MNTMKIITGCLAAIAIGVALAFVPETMFAFIGKMFCITSAGIAIAMSLQGKKV